jgi:hypothetical protein
MKKIMIAGLVTMCAGFSWAVAPLLYQQDFNIENGEASLLDRASGKKWELFKATVIEASTPVSQSGCVGSVKNGDNIPGQYGQYMQARQSFGTLKSMTAGGWIKVGEMNYHIGHILNTQVTAEKQGFGLNVQSSDFKLVFYVNTIGKVADYSITPDTWTFVAVTYDGTKNTDNLKVYASTNGCNLTLVSTLTHNQGAITASSGVLESGMFFRTGLFDSLRLYGSKTDDSGVLSEDEIKAWMEYSDTGAKPIILGAICPSGVHYDRI